MEPMLADLPQESWKPNGVTEIVGFLAHMQGLDLLSSDVLRESLYERRFDVLSALKSSNEDAGAEVCDSKWAPACLTCPPPCTLHDVFLGDTTASIHHFIASALYPGRVPWPNQNNSFCAGREESQGTNDECSSLHKYSEQWEGHQFFQDRPWYRFLQPAQQASESMQQSQPHLKQTGVCDKAVVEVMICGRKVNVSVRGQPLLGRKENADEQPVALSDDSRCTAARERREQLERAMKREQYQEKKIFDQIKQLESMRAAELEQQQEDWKREMKRQARMEELRGQLEAASQQPLPQVQTDDEFQHQKKKEEVEAKRKQQLREKQKKLLDQWLVMQVGKPFRIEAAARRRQHQERLAQENALEKEARAKKTTKQFEVEDKVRHVQMVTEERPPLPPRPHDLPAPNVDLSDECMSDSQAKCLHSRARTSSLSSHVKAISGAYGLSAPERIKIANNVTRTVTGPGRMAPKD